MPLLIAILVYGVLAFVAGFVFGTLREIVLIPWLGNTAGRWTEFIPLLTVIVTLGVWTTRRWQIGKPGQLTETLWMGIGSVALLLALESGFALFILQIPLDAYLAGFNVLEGRLFPLGLAVMALTPFAAGMLTGNK